MRHLGRVEPQDEFVHSLLNHRPELVVVIAGENATGREDRPGKLRLELRLRVLVRGIEVDDLGPGYLVLVN